MSISLIDLSVIIFVGLLGVRGLLRGSIYELFFLMGIVISTMVSTLYYKNAEAFLHKYITRVDWLPFLSFILLFLGTLIVVLILQAILSFGANRANGPGGREASGLFGLVIGFLNGLLLCSILLWFLKTQPFFSSKHLLEGSRFSEALWNYNPLISMFKAQLQF